MRKLSEIPAEEGMAIIGKLVPVIGRMAKKAGERNSENVLDYFGKLLEKAPEDAVTMCAIIEGVPREEYAKKNIMQVLADVNGMISDENLVELFKSQI